MRPASEVELRRLNDTFAELCAIRSPFGHERAVADRVAAELRSLGLEVEEDEAGAEIGGDAGNLLARLPGRSERTVLLCAHLDTVPDGGDVEPVLVDGAWQSAGETILGADNKATVAVLLALAHRAAVEGTPVGVELVFTVGEENGLQGAKAFDVSKLRSELGYVYDHASPIGEVVVASPTFYRLPGPVPGHGAATRPARRDVPRPGRARRRAPRGRPQRDPGRGARDRRDAPRPDRPGDDRERRQHPW